jgi:16S rRNA (cytosine1402-N4)-methyltransferase
LEAQVFHTPVLVKEAVSNLLTTRNGIYVDGTLGGGGHAEVFLEALHPSGKLIGIDLDEDAIMSAKKRLERFGDRAIFIKENFKNISSILTQLGIQQIQGAFLDLGISSYQIDEPTKGFSFRSDEPLDMRMDRGQSSCARDIVNQYDVQALTEIFWKYGEEQNARRIAQSIVNRRTRRPINTTGELTSIIEENVNSGFLIKTLARIFQAIRIEVNNELGNLQHALREFTRALAIGGRFVVISYHSLEDRLVKNAFRASSAQSLPSGNKLLPNIPVKPVLKVITQKPIIATDEEARRNPRSRSAKLRAAEKV